MKIFNALFAAGLLLAVVVNAQDHPDAMYLKEDAEWSHEMARQHREATQRVGKELDAYFEWSERNRASGLSSYWWSRLSRVYGRELDLLQKDIDSTRKRFTGRNPGCIRKLAEFEYGLYSEIRGNYAEYRHEKPEHEWLGPAIIGVFGGFPNPTCMIRHENVRKALEELRRVNPKN